LTPPWRVVPVPLVQPHNRLTYTLNLTLDAMQL